MRDLIRHSKSTRHRQYTINIKSNYGTTPPLLRMDRATAGSYDHYCLPPSSLAPRQQYRRCGRRHGRLLFFVYIYMHTFLNKMHGFCLQSYIMMCVFETVHKSYIMMCVRNSTQDVCLKQYTIETVQIISIKRKTENELYFVLSNCGCFDKNR